ncbi:MAG: response regulator [Ardenticatenaceae bacterium]|nr:response regulator [Ardenticatenaceae bacterium]
MGQKNQLRVLIADDVMETRRSTRLMLTLIPEARLVAVAQNGREAVEIARKQKLDIALMDVSMPEMDGVTAIEQMLKIQPGMGCIVISAERDSEILRRAMAVGAKGYLIKPTTTDEFVETFQRVANLIQSGQLQKPHTQHDQLERRIYLQQMAMQYVKSRRTDDQALAVFEELAAAPDCEVPWLQSLAVVYVFRQEWHKLAQLAERLAQATSPK